MKQRVGDKNPQREQLAQVRLMARIERQFSKPLEAEFNRFSTSLIGGAVRSGGKVPAGINAHEKKVTKIIKALTRLTIMSFGQRIADQVRKAQRKEFEEVFIEVAEDYIRGEAIRKRITSISETTRTRIVNAISSGQTAGVGIDDIANEIAKTSKAISKARGALIARTETHAAANAGAHAGALETGVDLKREWVAAQDERTRFTHANADRQIVDMKKPFNVGGARLMYPGDPAGPPEETINCRCAVSHVIED